VLGGARPLAPGHANVLSPPPPDYVTDDDDDDGDDDDDDVGERSLRWAESSKWQS
jgi:hypothetical protein